MRRCVPLLLGMTMLADPVPAFTIDLPRPPGDGMTAPQVFERIDSLQALYPASAGDERATIAFNLGELYIATGASKHLAIAQDYLDEAGRLRPGWPDPVYTAAAALARSGYYDLARARMKALLELEPRNVEHLCMLGRLEFAAARSTIHRQDMNGAYQIYVTALGTAPDDPDVLHGAAVTSLLVENFQLARSCAAHLRGLRPESAEVWFLGAAAQHRLGNDQQAWVEFLRGFALCGAPEREVFLGGAELVTDEMLVSLARDALDPARARRGLGLPADAPVDWNAVVEVPALRAELVERWWMRRDESPDAFENESELEFWTRLVEADLLFSRPVEGVRGWQTLPGEVWMRMGRPQRQTFHLPDTQLDSSERSAPGPSMDPGSRYSGSLTFEPPRRLWDWDYLIDGRWLNVQFSDFGYGDGNWGVGPGSRTDVGTLRNEVAFVPPGHQRERASFELGAVIDRFPRGNESVLETTLSVRALDPGGVAFVPPDSVLVEWVLCSAEGDTLDRILRPVTAASSLARLVEASGQIPRPLVANPRLARIGARVASGHYRIRVRAIDPENGNYSAKTFDVVVPRSQPNAVLAMSSVQLCHGLPPWVPGSDFPLEFVKHGRAVISAPRAVVESDVLGVFYEIENLARDETGQTRFDVEYAVYEGTGQVRLLAMLGEFEPDALEEVELATVEYLHERTGVSPDGLVVKGTEIDISGLPEGDYVLRVVIDDRLSGQRCATAVAFRRPARNRPG